MNSIKIIFIYFFALLLSCSEQSTNTSKAGGGFSPSHFPEIKYPADNQFSRERFELGRLLFYDTILSQDSSIASCSHCHKPEFNFGDNSPLSAGNKGNTGIRNAMPLTNFPFRNLHFWDGSGVNIEKAIYKDIFHPAFFGSDTNVINSRLKSSPVYSELFAKAYGSSAEPSCYMSAKAIFIFINSIVSGNSDYDRYLLGNTNAITESAKRGLDLFKGKGKCGDCHSGLFMTDGAFHSTGITTHYFDRGLFEFTGRLEDRGKFLTPSLRNVELSSPYMHDGTIESLEDVIYHYNHGGYPFFNKDMRIVPLGLTQSEIYDLIQFLKSLTDKSFINNPLYSKPADLK